MDRWPRHLWLIAALVLPWALTPGLATAAGHAEQLKRELGAGVRVAEHRETGRVRFVGAPAGRPISRPPGVDASAPPAQAARAFLDRYGDSFGIRDQARELRATATVPGVGGRSTVRFQQLHDGVPVLGGELLVNLDAARNVLSASGEVLPAPKASTAAAVTAAVARDTAIGTVAKERRVPPGRLAATIPRLWIYDAGILGGPGPESSIPVWRLEIRGDGPLPINELVLVDARSGVVALRIDQIAHAKNRQVCDGANTTANYPCTTPGATGASESDPPAPPDHADVGFAFDYAGDTYDFFAGLGRDSLDGAGMTLESTVRHCPSPADCPYQNAFWDGQQMVYGQGFAAADDVVGHELTHGVTDFSAHLFYYYQSGAINESMSDVFGEFVDLTNGSGTDTAAVKWQMGEDVPGFGAIRDMEDPTSFGDPDRMTSPNYSRRRKRQRRRPHQQRRQQQGRVPHDRRRDLQRPHRHGPRDRQGRSASTTGC